MPTPLGDSGQRLCQWMFKDSGGGPGTGLTEADKEVFDELRSQTGAMISGRRLYDITRGWRCTSTCAGVCFAAAHIHGPEAGYRFGSDRGSPNHGSTLLSKRVMAQIRSPVRVRT